MTSTEVRYLTLEQRGLVVAPNPHSSLTPVVARPSAPPSVSSLSSSFFRHPNKYFAPPHPACSHSHILTADFSTLYFLSPFSASLFSNTAILRSNNGVKRYSRHFRRTKHILRITSIGSPTSINERLKRSVPQRSHASSTFLTETLNHHKKNKKKTDIHSSRPEQSGAGRAQARRIEN